MATGEGINNGGTRAEDASSTEHNGHQAGAPTRICGVHWSHITGGLTGWPVADYLDGDGWKALRDDLEALTGEELDPAVTYAELSTVPLVVAQQHAMWPSDTVLARAEVASFAEQHGLEDPHAVAERLAQEGSLKGEQERQRVLEMFGGDPQPLRSGGLPPFPVDALPGPYGDMVAATATAVQVDSAMVGPIMLGALSAACGGCVEPVPRPGWDEICVLHIVVTADPSERKSAVFKKMTQPLYRAEKALIESTSGTRTEQRARRDIADRKAKNAASKAAEVNSGKRGAGDADDGSSQLVDPVRYAVNLAQAAEAIVVPELPRVLADDATPEALASRMADNYGRLAVMSAEAGVFATLAGRYSSKGEANLDIWLKGYTGDPHRVDRQGRPDEEIDRPALTVCLTAQPDVLQKVCSNTEFHGRGVLPRISFALPTSMVGRRDPEAPPIPETIEKTYTTALTTLAHQLHAREGEAAKVKFSPAAERAVIELLRAVEKRLVGDGDLSGSMREWGGRYVGRVVRIALLLHMAEHGPSGVDVTVAAETVTAAVRIAEFFVAHTRAAFGIANTGAVQLSDLTATLDYLRRHHEVHRLQPITVRQLSKSGPLVLRRKSSRDPVLAMLVDFNLIALGQVDGKSAVYAHPDLGNL